MTQYVKEKIETIEQPVTIWFLLSLAFIFICAYAYFVNGAITNIVEAKETQGEITERGSKVGNLEAELLTAKSHIELSQALSIGSQVKASDIIYVAKKSRAPLSFNR